MLITSQLLAERGACRASQRKLEELFPGGVVPTEALIRQHVSNFAWSWAIMLLLTGKHRAAAQHEEIAVVTAREKACNAAYVAHDESIDDNRFRVLGDTLDEIYQQSHLQVALIFLKHFIAQNSPESETP
jgi:hypothetical protein